MNSSGLRDRHSIGSLALLAALVLALTVGASVALAATITGTSGDDFLSGTNQADIIDARSGDDNVRGNDGDDVIYGGLGNDVIRPGPGADTIYAAGNNDFIDAADDGVSTTRDEIECGAGNDTVIIDLQDVLLTTSNCEDIRLDF